MGLLKRIDGTQKDEAGKLNNVNESSISGFEISPGMKSSHIKNDKERELKYKIQRRIIEEYANEKDVNKLVSIIDSLTIEIIQKKQHAPVKV
jgi:hypothetical protein